MSGTREWRRCPRCRAAVFEAGRGALSRTTRDEGAEIEVCSRCGVRESLYGYDPAAQPPFTEWPLPPEELADEELKLIASEQRSEIRVMTMTPDDARKMLGESEGA